MSTPNLLNPFFYFYSSVFPNRLNISWAVTQKTLASFALFRDYPQPTTLTIQNAQLAATLLESVGTAPPNNIFPTLDKQIVLTYTQGITNSNIILQDNYFFVSSSPPNPHQNQFSIERNQVYNQGMIINNNFISQTIPMNNMVPPTTSPQ